MFWMNAPVEIPMSGLAAIKGEVSLRSPRRRYMVTPNADQAQLTISAAMQRLLELNADQSYSYDREQLIAL